MYLKRAGYFDFVYGDDFAVAQWVGQNIVDGYWEKPVAIGLQRRGELIAGVVYDMYYPGVSIRMHVAAKPGSGWAKHNHLTEFFSYPFKQLKVKRVTAPVLAKNKPASLFLQKIGFTLEGCMRQESETDDDMLIFGMLKSECRWLHES